MLAVEVERPVHDRDAGLILPVPVDLDRLLGPPVTRGTRAVGWHTGAMLECRPRVDQPRRLATGRAHVNDHLTLGLGPRRRDDAGHSDPLVLDDGKSMHRVRDHDRHV